MTHIEAYLFLFFDSIMSTMILVPNTEMVYKAMQIFSGYNNYYIVIISSCGAVLGGGINYLFGIALRSLKRKVSNTEESTKFKYLESYVDRRLCWLLVLSFVPLIGVLLTTFSGFFRVRFYKMLLIVLFTRVFYYIIILNLF